MLPLLTLDSSPFPKRGAYSISVSSRLSWLGFKSVFNSLNQEFSLSSHRHKCVTCGFLHSASVAQWSPRLNKHCLCGAGIIFKWPPFPNEHSVNAEQTTACAHLEHRDPNSPLDTKGTLQQKSALKSQFHHFVEGCLLQHMPLYIKACSFNLQRF